VTRAGRRTAHEPPYDVSLPTLTAFASDALEPHGDYDAVQFVDCDFSKQSANNAKFLDCHLAQCRADGLLLRRARFVECLVTDLAAVGVDLAESVWRDSMLVGGRVGAMTAHAAQFARVRVRGGKYDFVNLRGATLQDVVFEGCLLGEVDAADASLTNVTFVDCRVDDLNVSNATLENVDLRGASLKVLHGLQNLRGAMVSNAQLLDLAPLLADHLGIAVSDD
jgi:uncharacterized protein YjbI with pentapeptide repeats